MYRSLIRKRFREAVEREDAAIDLGYAALLIAQEEYRDLNPATYLARLDDLAARARRYAAPGAGPGEVAEAVNEVLFLEEGLAGNQRDYYDPRNSFLNEVLDRKRGIPITLSIVYLEVARRLGLNVEGIGLPGHFIVGVLTSSASEAGETPLLVDPFFGGKFLTPADCAARVQQLYGDRVQFSRSMLAPSSRRHILIRLLTNLKVIYANRSDHGRALAAIDRLMILNPGSAQELRDRGAICQQMKFHGQALADLTRYLELAPHAADADSVREAVRALHREAAPAN